MRIALGKASVNAPITVTTPASIKQRLADPTVISLILSNLLAIGFALAFNLNIMAILWVYWSQSVIIGFFNFFRILSLKKFSTEGIKVNYKPIEATNKTKVMMAFFFAFHYGFFHLVYAFFLGAFTFANMTGSPSLSIPDFGYIGLMAIVFFANHLFSFRYNRKRDEKKQNIGRVMGYPYARIIPMHFTIILGGMFLASGTGGTVVLVFFLGLKTLADVAMHLLEHAK